MYKMKDALRQLSVVKPGLWDYKHNKPILEGSDEWNTSNYLNENCCISLPNDLLTRKIGLCYDTSLYLYDYLKKNKHQVKYFVMCNNIKSKNFTTHTFIISRRSVRYDWRWVEYSWTQYKGCSIHKFDKKLLLAEISKIFQKQNGEVYHLGEVQVDTILNKPLITFEEYFNFLLGS